MTNQNIELELGSGEQIISESEAFKTVDQSNLKTLKTRRKSSVDFLQKANLKLKMRQKLLDARSHIAERKAGRFVISQRNPLKLFWDCCNLAFLTYSIFEIFYALGFATEACDWPWYAVLDLIVDCFFMCDCILNFFSAYQEISTGREITEWETIAKNYVCGWFVLDFTSSIPIDRIVCAIGNISSSQVRFLKFARLLKVLRILRLLRTAIRLEEEFGHLLHSSVRFMKFLILMALFIHICATFWFLSIEWGNCQIPAEWGLAAYFVCGCSADEDCVDWNWLVKYAGGQENYQRSMANRSHYLPALYYTVVTMTTLGYGDITPSNDYELAAACVLSLLGAVMFSFLIGAIGGLLSRTNAVELAIEDSVSRCIDLVRFKGMPHTFEKEVRRQLTHAMTAAPHNFADLAVLPRATRNRLLGSLAAELLSGLDLLLSLDEDARARLVQVLRPCVFDRGDWVFRAGDAATELYWIRSGEVSLLGFSDPRSPRDEPAGRTAPRSSLSVDGGDWAVRPGAEEDRAVSSARRGEIFGELELFDVDTGSDLGEQAAAAGDGCDSELERRDRGLRLGRYRVCGARARTRCELLELRQEDLEGTVRALMPSLYANILQCATERGRGVEWERHYERMRETLAERTRSWGRMLARSSIQAGAVARKWSSGADSAGGFHPSSESRAGSPLAASATAAGAGRPSHVWGRAVSYCAGGASASLRAAAAESALSAGGAGSTRRSVPRRGSVPALGSPGEDAARKPAENRTAAEARGARSGGGLKAAGQAPAPAERPEPGAQLDGLRADVLALQAQVGQVLVLLEGRAAGAQGLVGKPDRGVAHLKGGQDGGSGGGPESPGLGSDGGGREHGPPDVRVATAADARPAPAGRNQLPQAAGPAQSDGLGSPGARSGAAGAPPAPAPELGAGALAGSRGRGRRPPPAQREAAARTGVAAAAAAAGGDGARVARTGGPGPVGNGDVDAVGGAPPRQCSPR